jgi:hypothetical protein
MVGKGMPQSKISDEPSPGNVRNVAWWVFYSLFLVTMLYLLFLMIRTLSGEGLWDVSSFGQLIYAVGLWIAVLGLIGLCILYIVRVMFCRLKNGRRGEGSPG